MTLTITKCWRRQLSERHNSVNKVPIARLTKIFCQSSESPIPIAAREIISGNKPVFSLISRSPYFNSPEPFAFIPCSANTFFDILQDFLKNTVSNIYNLDPVKMSKYLYQCEKTIGQENINKIMQNFLNPQNEHKKECALAYGGLLEKVTKSYKQKIIMELDVFNGDLGYCKIHC